MADYNVNMKQWNGSSFDNVLPLAFNSKALEGKSYDDIIQYVQSSIGTGGKNVITQWGSYVGNGKYGASNKNVIVCGFTPVMVVIVPYSDNNYGSPTTGIKSYNKFGLVLFENTITWGNDRVSWYSEQRSSQPMYQFNVSGVTYPYIVFGYQES